MCFSKKHNTKGLKMMKAKNTKPMSTPVEAIKVLVKHKVKPKVPQGCNHNVSGLTYTAHRRFGKCVRAPITKGLLLCQPRVKAKAQSKPQAADADADADVGTALATYSSAQVRMKSS
ncbi:60S ribosomal protein L29-like [Phyllostomus discolor]|uniref:60S ribosomal protein L29-like n=1 Tax=Phyllostomus discolor TaxID=89673 RepID=A0A6J2MSQ3_9CHIR|nr:60S ribosomal protein L29-like [Phyllostomus discolor]